MVCFCAGAIRVTVTTRKEITAVFAGTICFRKYIKQMGIEPERLKLEWISASEGKQFADLINSFTETITELGPCKIKETMEVLT